LNLPFGSIIVGRDAPFFEKFGLLIAAGLIVPFAAAQFPHD